MGWEELTEALDEPETEVEYKELGAMNPNHLLAVLGKN